MKMQYQKIIVYLSFVLMTLLAVSFGLYKYNKKIQQNNTFLVKEVSKPPPEIKWMAAMPDQKKILLEDKSNCQLNIKVNCSITFGKKQWLSLGAKPKPLATNKTILFTIQTSDESVVPKEIEFTGVNLNLGILKSSIKKIKKNIYFSQIKLPIFDEKKLRIKATVLIQQKPKNNLKKIDGLVFNFSLFH